MFNLFGLSFISHGFFISNIFKIISFVNTDAVAVNAIIFTFGARDLSSCKREYHSRNTVCFLLFDVPLQSSIKSNYHKVVTEGCFANQTGPWGVGNSISNI